MIKAKMTGEDNQPVFLLGLSEGNLQLLRERRPIMVDLAKLEGPPCKVVIAWGPTEAQLMLELRASGWLDEPADEMSGPLRDQPPGERFPRGKIHPHDEGQLRTRIFIKDNTLVFDFGKPVAWFGLGLHEARELQRILGERIAELEGKEA